MKKNQRPWQYGGDAGGDEKCDGGDGCVAADGGEDYQCGPLHAPETHLDQQTDADLEPGTWQPNPQLVWVPSPAHSVATTAGNRKPGQEGP